MATCSEDQLAMFEAMVLRSGPEAALRTASQVFGEDTALAAKLAWEKKVGVVSDLRTSATLRERRWADWYSGPGEDDRFWPALKRYLLEKKGWPSETVESLDRESTGVVRMLAPVSGAVDVKGLVVGYVQSGKTANYTAVIAKAADVGYRLIIVLAGIHNSLRRQTQERLQAELIDADDLVRQQWHTLSSAMEDFRARGTNADAFLTNSSHQRILLVVKKNAVVLRRLVKWLSSAQPRILGQCPALVIDDEADQAGLNTAADEARRTAINGLILSLKKILPKSAYVGYTATPFANVLVNPSGEDLYPSDFIVALSKPASYFGTELFFGRDPLGDEGDTLPTPPDMFRSVPKDEVAAVRPLQANGAASFTPSVPPSLRTAIRYFILATAARWARGHRKKHSSMLIHTAMQVAVHNALAGVVSEELRLLREGIRDGSAIEDLVALWADEHGRAPSPNAAPVSFADLLPIVPEVLDRCNVVIDNSKSDTRLLYKEEHQLTDADPVAHVAVGGNTLSRGLTLEGLIVSYFVRSATAYDTLLQMGRWFGYRIGYEDLPRIWMTDDLRDSFHDLATVEEEIRRDIAKYEEDNVTPREFAVRIRTHPTLAVTSRLKMRHAMTVNIDYVGLTRQTTFFRHEDAQWLADNWNAGARLLADVIEAGMTFEKDGPHQFVRRVPASFVLSFLGDYRSHEGHTELRSDFVRSYIQKQNTRGACTHWTVAAVSLTRNLPSERLGPLNVAPVNRSKLRNRADGVDLGTITTQANFGFDLPADARKTTESGDKRRQPRRPIGSDPLLLLIPIDKASRFDNSPGWRERHPNQQERADLNAVSHILGMALAFPDRPGDALEENYIQVQLAEPTVYIDDDDVPVPEEDDG